MTVIEIAITINLHMKPIQSFFLPRIDRDSTAATP